VIPYIATIVGPTRGHNLAGLAEPTSLGHSPQGGTKWLNHGERR